MAVLGEKAKDWQSTAQDLTLYIHSALCPRRRVHQEAQTRLLKVFCVGEEWETLGGLFSMEIKGKYSAGPSIYTEGCNGKAGLSTFTTGLPDAPD